MMAFVNEWFTFDNAIDEGTCNKIISTVNDDWEEGSVGPNREFNKEERLKGRKLGRKGDYRVDPDARDSSVIWSDEQWIINLIRPFMLQANHNAGWRYNITATESSQITRYKKGGFYNFHIDGAGDHLTSYDLPDKPFMHGNVRKLSMSVMLNEDFDGGEFEFASYKDTKCLITSFKAKIGDIIVFPSVMEHRVAPVIKGTRYSLVNWFVGPPFV